MKARYSVKCGEFYLERRRIVYKKILVPLDGSPFAEAVLPHAQEIALKEGAEIILLRIPAAPAAEFLNRQPAIAARIVDGETAAAEKYVAAKMKSLERRNIKAQAITRVGPVPDTILEVAETTHADLIAMSTHGRTGAQRWLLGSVADQIVHRARIPVMLIHPN